MDSVKNTIIWGNHSNTQYPDLEHVLVGDMIGDDIIESIGKEYLPQYIQVNLHISWLHSVTNLLF